MTISQSLVLVFIIAIWSTGNGVNLANNTTLLIILLIALMSLVFSTRRTYCPNSQTMQNALNNLSVNNLLF